jgi:hypothetical protein
MSELRQQSMPAAASPSNLGPQTQIQTWQAAPAAQTIVFIHRSPELNQRASLNYVKNALTQTVARPKRPGAAASASDASLLGLIAHAHASQNAIKSYGITHTGSGFVYCERTLSKYGCSSASATVMRARGLNASIASSRSNASGSASGNKSQNGIFSCTCDSISK